MALNRAILMGRISCDLELRQTTTGIPVLQFAIAVDRDSATNGGEKKVDFIDCVAWRKTAEFISRYFHKGKLIIVDGSLQVEKWQDKEGKKRKNTKISVQNVHFCGDKASSSNNQYGYPQQQYQQKQSVEYFDDLTNEFGSDEYNLPDDGDLPF